MSSKSFDSDEFYYSDGESDAPVSAVEKKFLDAKNGIENDPKESVKLLTEILVEDESVKGRWTYKSLKNLAKAYRQMGAHEKMLDSFKQCFGHTYEEISKGKMEKAMNKFIDTSEAVPHECVMQLLEVTLEKATTDPKAYSDLWSGTMLRKATLLFEAGAHDEALVVCRQGVLFCEGGSRAIRTNDTHHFNLLKTEMQIAHATGDHLLLRESYFALTRIPVHRVNAPQVGVVALLAGHMYMRAQDWHAAHKSFVQAFQHMNECGDPQRIACLKYANIASMLTGSPADAFSGGEEKPYAEHKELVPVVKLLRAFIRTDIRSFQAVLADAQNAECLQQDELVREHEGLLLFRLRLNALLRYVDCFIRASLAELAERLTLSVADTKVLCAYAIGHGLISARLDDSTNTLNVYSTTRTTEYQRTTILADWSTDLNNALLSQQVTWVTHAVEEPPARQ